MYWVTADSASNLALLASLMAVASSPFLSALRMRESPRVKCRWSSVKAAAGAAVVSATHSAAMTAGGPVAELRAMAFPRVPVDPDAPLRYRVQTFISRSMGLSFVFAACMTLFLACGTVAFEIRDRQIWQVVSKPNSLPILSKIN